MQKPDPKGNGESDDPIVREGVTDLNNDGTKEGKGFQKGTHDSEIKSHRHGKKGRRQSGNYGKSSKANLKNLSHVKKSSSQRRVIDFAPATSNSFFKDDGFNFFHRFEMDSIPVS